MAIKVVEKLLNGQTDYGLQWSIDNEKRFAAVSSITRTSMSFMKRLDCEKVKSTATIDAIT